MSAEIIKISRQPQAKQLSLYSMSETASCPRLRSPLPSSASLTLEDQENMDSEMLAEQETSSPIVMQNPNVISHQVDRASTIL